MTAILLTEHRIKQAALQLFGEKGYKGASLSSIAKVVGIKAPSIYAHFSSKEALFLAVLDDVISDEFLDIQKMLIKGQNQPVKEQISHFFHYFTQKEEHNKVYYFIKRNKLFAPESIQEQIREKFTAYEERATTLLLPLFEEGIQKGVFLHGEASELLNLFYCLIDGLTIEKEFYTKNAYEQQQHRILETFWNLICTPTHVSNATSSN